MSGAGLRQASRLAAREWAELARDARAMYLRIAQRWAEQDDLLLWEFADESGVSRGHLQRAARSAGLCDSFGNPRRRKSA